MKDENHRQERSEAEELQDMMEFAARDGGSTEQGADEQDAVPAEEIAPEGGEEGDETAQPKAGSEVEVLQNEVSLLEDQLQNMRDRYIRAVADLDNARKRARQAIAEARKDAVAGVLLDLLTLVDNFERALETAEPDEDASPETRAVYEGIDLIYRQLLGLLERRGVKAIEAQGQSFNPKRHEAVARIPAGPDQQEGTVVLEMQKGYMYGDQVLRPSRVGVAVAEEEEGPERAESDE